MIKHYYLGAELEQDYFVLVLIKGPVGVEPLSEQPRVSQFGDHGTLVQATLESATRLVRDGYALAVDLDGVSPTSGFAFRSVRSQFARIVYDDKLKNPKNMPTLLFNDNGAFYVADSVEQADMLIAIGEAVPIGWSNIKNPVLSKEASLEFLQGGGEVEDGDSDES